MSRIKIYSSTLECEPGVINGRSKKDRLRRSRAHHGRRVTKPKVLTIKLERRQNSISDKKVSQLYDMEIIVSAENNDNSKSCRYGIVCKCITVRRKLDYVLLRNILYTSEPVYNLILVLESDKTI